jgi:hypothetical protein
MTKYKKAWSFICTGDKPIPVTREELYQMLRLKTVVIGDVVMRVEDNVKFTVVNGGTFAVLKDDNGNKFCFKKQHKGFEFVTVE